MQIKPFVLSIPLLAYLPAAAIPLPASSAHNSRVNSASELAQTTPALYDFSALNLGIPHSLSKRAKSYEAQQSELADIALGGEGLRETAAKLLGHTNAMLNVQRKMLEEEAGPAPLGGSHSKVKDNAVLENFNNLQTAAAAVHPDDHDAVNRHVESLVSEGLAQPGNAPVPDLDAAGIIRNSLASPSPWVIE